MVIRFYLLLAIGIIKIYKTQLCGILGGHEILPMCIFTMLSVRKRQTYTLR